MGNAKSIIATVLFCILLFTTINAQITTYSNGQNNQIKLDFAFEKIESEAHSTIFNILKIINNSSVIYTGEIYLSAPKDWNIIGENEIKVSIPASDSLSMPVRVSISKDALGEIGYSVMATLSSNIGMYSSYSSYFYVTIPRYTNLIASPEKFIHYIPESQSTSYFHYNVNNKGNVPELVHMELRSDENLIVNESKKGIYVDEFGLKPHSDTILVIPLTNKVEDDSRTYNWLDIQSFNNDTLYHQTVWFKILKDQYKYNIPSNQKCAIVEFNAYNIFGKNEPTYTLRAKGAILFKKESEFYYSFFSNFRDYSYSGVDLGYFNNAYVGYKNKYVNFQLGNVQGNYEQSITGIGINSEFKYKKDQLKGTYLEGIYSSYTGYGGSLNIGTKFAGFQLGGLQTLNRTYNVDTKLGFAGISFPFLKINSFSFIYGLSEVVGNSVDILKGYGINSIYSLKTKKLLIDVRVKFGSPYYTGVYGGRFDIKAIATYSFAKKSYLKITYDKFNYSVFNFLQYNAPNSRKNLFDRYELSYGQSINENVNFRTGLITKYESANFLYNLNPDSFFTILSPGVFGESDIHYEKLTFSPRIEIYRSFKQQSGNENIQIENGYTAVNVSANLYTKNIGVYSLFKYNASSIFEHFIYEQTGDIIKWFYLMPYYKKYFFKKSLLLDLRGNYMNNLNNNERTFNFTTQLVWSLPNDFTIRFQNSIYSRNRIDLNTNIKYSYSNLYFEAGIRKEFNCNQPRHQYHDLKIVFYRDINGDNKKDQNEPGILNVLAEIVRDYDLNKTKGNNFTDMQFLSNELGTIDYKNIQNGFYILKYKLLSEIIGNLSTEQLTMNFEMEKSKTIYVPYKEQNKIIGKVILNRDPLSNQGIFDLANIRITAEDTKGNFYSALTDKSGNFTLYTPQADHYIVRINNIFHESFDLQQSEFIVKFNGFKQFEVTFIFNEKKVKINFDTEITKDDVKYDLKVIRKTILAGKIDDGLTQHPINATIQIVDNSSNKVITEANSNELNGNYSISYAANVNYRIVVKANGYNDYEENLYYEQIISIQNFTLDIHMTKLSDSPRNQTFIMFNDKQDENFTQNFKSGQKIPMNNLNFAEKETRLSPEAYPELDRLIDLLNKNKSVRIEVAGHSDDTGTDRIDNLLALRRAAAIQKYLISHGLTEDRIIVKSYSNSRPLVPGTSEKAKQKNRRVEITVL